jgi:hypothetical protein
MQWRFITAMLEDKSRSKKDAAEHIGITPDTVYRWGSHVDDALAIARRNEHETTLAMRRQSLIKAMRVKIALLDSDDENVRQRAANDIIEWELGKATQKQEVVVRTPYDVLLDRLNQRKQHQQNAIDIH